MQRLNLIFKDNQNEIYSMLKGIAVQAIFLIAVIAISLFFMVAIFWGWIDTTKFGVSEATCKADWIGCCSALISGTGKCELDSACSEYNIKQPTLEDCCNLPQYKGLSSKCK